MSITYAAEQQAEAQITSDILDHLTNMGLTGTELHQTARAWMCTQAEINLWASQGNAHHLTTEKDKATREITKLATQMERAIINRGQVLTPSLRTATPETLLAAIDYYENQLDTLWPTYQAATTPEERAPILEQWDRLNGYLWEAKTQAELPTVIVQVLTGTSLTNKLEQALSSDA